MNETKEIIVALIAALVPVVVVIMALSVIKDTLSGALGEKAAGFISKFNNSAKKGGVGGVGNAKNWLSKNTSLGRAMQLGKAGRQQHRERKIAEKLSGNGVFARFQRAVGAGRVGKKGQHARSFMQNMASNETRQADNEARQNFMKDISENGTSYEGETVIGANGQSVRYREGKIGYAEKAFDEAMRTGDAVRMTAAFDALHASGSSGAKAAFNAIDRNFNSGNIPMLKTLQAHADIAHPGLKSKDVRQHGFRNMVLRQENMEALQEQLHTADISGLADEDVASQIADSLNSVPEAQQDGTRAQRILNDDVLKTKLKTDQQAALSGWVKNAPQRGPAGFVQPTSASQPSSVKPGSGPVAQPSNPQISTPSSQSSKTSYSDSLNRQTPGTVRDSDPYHDGMLK